MKELEEFKVKEDLRLWHSSGLLVELLEIVLDVFLGQR